MKTFLWYDIETFGLNPKYDRLAQFAAIRTDMDMNVIDEPVLIYVKLSPDYLPSPDSCLVTGITPQEVNSKGIAEAEAAERIRDLFMEPDTIVTGYNSVSFDDEVMRNLFYRNLYDPYEREYGAGRSRWDIINLVRAARDLRPQGMNFSIINPETGASSFKLTDLTAENNIDQVGAHDALVDVWATIAVAKLIKEKQPNLFSWALSIRSKTEIRNFLNTSHFAPMLYTSSMFVSEKGNTHPVLPIAIDPLESNTLYCFDLTKDIPESSACSYPDTGIFRLAINRIPFIAPLSVLDSESEERLGFTRKDILAKAEQARKAPSLSRQHILEAKEERQKAADTDPDLAIYDRLTSIHDKNLLSRIRTLRPEERLRSGEYVFDDPKYHQLLWRQVARSWPEALPENEKIMWRNFCAKRLLSPILDNVKTYELYMREVQEKLDSLDTDGRSKTILLKLREYGEELYRKVIVP